MKPFGSFIIAAGVLVLWTGEGVSQDSFTSGVIPIAEVKFGGLVHDVGKGNNESYSVDVNFEVIFTEVRLFDFENKVLDFVFSPRPMIGASINTEGDTHQAYAGVNWEYQFVSEIFIGASLGGVGHTGNLHQDTMACRPGEGCALPGNRAYVDTGETSLGSRILFRESLEIGIRFADGQSISIFGAHMSNAGFSGDNDSMNFVGIRYGYAFGNRGR